jgi:hypothetical protein
VKCHGLEQRLFSDGQAALTNPELIEAARGARSVFMRRYFDERLQRDMLVRAVVEETAEEWVSPPFTLPRK